MYSIPILRAGFTVDVIDCIMKNRRGKIKKSNIVYFPGQRFLVKCILSVFVTFVIFRKYYIVDDVCKKSGE